MGAMTKGFSLGVVARLIVGIAVWLTVAYTGLYSVAASDSHADVVRWTLETTMRRSVASRADEVELPATFVERMPGLFPEGYTAMTGGASRHHGDASGSE